jgi:hypothetical protein
MHAGFKDIRKMVDNGEVINLSFSKQEVARTEYRVFRSLQTTIKIFKFQPVTENSEKQLGV